MFLTHKELDVAGSAREMWAEAEPKNVKLCKKFIAVRAAGGLQAGSVHWGQSCSRSGDVRGGIEVNEAQPDAS